MSSVDNELLITKKILFALDTMKPEEAVAFLNKFESGLGESDYTLFQSVVVEVIWFFTDTDSKEMNDYAEKKIANHNGALEIDEIHS